MGGPDFKNYPGNNLRAQSVLCTARCFALPLFLQLVILCQQLGVVTGVGSEEGPTIKYDMLAFVVVAVVLTACPGLAIIYCACAGVYALNRNLLLAYAVTNGLCTVYFVFVILSLLIFYASIDAELWLQLVVGFGYFLLVVLPLGCATVSAAVHGVAAGSAMRLRGDLLYFVAAAPPGELDTEIDTMRAQKIGERVGPRTKGKQVMYWTSDDCKHVTAIGVDTTGKKQVDHVLHLEYDGRGVGRVAHVEPVGPLALPAGGLPIRAAAAPSPAASSEGRSGRGGNARRTSLRS